MPYNTRRISLSLPSLGVHLPGSHSSRAHNKAQNTSGNIAPPPKRIKRSHTLGSIPSPSSTSTATPPPRLHSRASSTSAPRPAGPAIENTPPPSPPGFRPTTKLDTTGINDDIVVAVLQQLEKTGNRPHLIKELVAILINTLSVVESSANPAAIISSRLTNYLKRPWSALAPCPLAKEQTVTHPRSVFYFLTTCPRQQVPDFSTLPSITKRVISPSLSSGPDEEEETILRKRKRESLSSELGFSLRDIDHLNTAQVETVDLSYIGSDFPQDEDLLTERPNITHNRRAASPPLEHDEREFTQTANVMQQRRQSEQEKQQQQQQQTVTSPSESLPGLEITLEPVGLDETESEESVAMRNQEAATALFGQSHHLLHIVEDTFGGGSSPMMRPLHQDLHVVTTPRKAYGVVDCSDLDLDGATALFDDGAWGELKSAESVELAELDDLLGEY